MHYVKKGPQLDIKLNNLTFFFIKVSFYTKRVKCVVLEAAVMRELVKNAKFTLDYGVSYFHYHLL